MKKVAIAGLSIALLAGVAVSNMQDEAPESPSWEMPKPQKEHEWLKQLEGEWTAKVQAAGWEGGEGFESTGTESVRSIGGFWIVAENKGNMMGTPFTGLLTLGYDLNKGKYVGSWIDSMTSYMWTYEGEVKGNTIMLNSDGPNPENPSERIKFQDSIEIKDKDHKVFTSKMLGDNGEWHTMMTITYTRKQ